MAMKESLIATYGLGLVWWPFRVRECMGESCAQINQEKWEAFLSALDLHLDM